MREKLSEIRVPETETKEITPEDIFSEFDIKEGEPVGLDKIRQIVVAHRPEIIEGLKRNFYSEIKTSLYGKRAQNIRLPYYLIKQDDSLYPTYKDSRYLDFIWFLETSGEDQEKRWGQLNESKLVFSFQANREEIQGEARKSGRTADFTGHDILRLDKIYLGQIPMDAFNRRLELAKYPNLEEGLFADDKGASYENLKELLSEILHPAEKFEDANKKIDELWGKYHFPLKDARSFKKGIWEFGNYEYRERNGNNMVGHCTQIPGEFNSFMKRRFRVQLQIAELTGAHRAILEYSPEERAEMEREKAGTVVHEGSVYGKMIVIDWTSRQFGQDKSIPEIRDITAEPGFRQKIEII